MDPLSHAAFGSTLIGAVTSNQLNRPLRACVVAAALGALAPDLDAALMPLGWDRYLRAHEIGTHTIVGTLACAPVTAAAVRFFSRPGSFWWLTLSAWIGAASHVLLDLVSGARLRPGWPLIDTPVSVPLVAMADPWLLACCVAGPAALWAGGSRGRSAARAVLVVMAGFLLAKAMLGSIAFSSYTNASDRSAEVVLASETQAKWASLTSWYVFDRTAQRVRVWSVGSDGSAQEVLSWPVGLESAGASSSRSLSTVRNFLRAHELGFTVTMPQDGGRTLVLWSDIRFCWDPAPPGASKLEPIVRSTTEDRQLACSLWFGGEFDADGRARQEIVKVGGFTQTRLPPR